MDRDDILSSIVKGAEYIEKIGNKHAAYKPAINKYNRLVKQLFEVDGRNVDGLP